MRCENCMVKFKAGFDLPDAASSRAYCWMASSSGRESFSRSNTAPSSSPSPGPALGRHWAREYGDPFSAAG